MRLDPSTLLVNGDRNGDHEMSARDSPLPLCWRRSAVGTFCETGLIRLLAVPDLYGACAARVNRSCGSD